MSELKKPRRAEPLRTDGVVVLGAGLAGLTAALSAAKAGRSVLVLAAAEIGEGCASFWAQGGLAVALSPDDSPALHAADTVAAGAGLVDPVIAALLAEEGPQAVTRLADLGAPFDRDSEGRFIQGLEAAHSRARVARVGGDGAGRAIMQAVVAAAAREPGITIAERWEGRVLLRSDEGRVIGVLAETPDELVEVLAPATILATGGLGGLYAVTTNPPQARGAGLVLAAAAGAVIRDPEFVQFHPTAIDIGRDPAPLATEALRGEGAVLIDRDGHAFMTRYDRRGDLAPRDVVARAIERQRTSGQGAFLDGRAAVGAHFPNEFPAVFAACMSANLDPRDTPIPVAPAAHYHMGGIKTDAEGWTGVEGLWAVGECASTGVHGANRLASNSLLEAAVFGAHTGRAAAVAAAPPVRRAFPASRPPRLPGSVLQRLRQSMSRDAGVVRTHAGLRRLLQEIGAMRQEHGLASELAAASFVAIAALARRESRGGHFRLDHPDLATPSHTDLVQKDLSAVGALLVAAD